VGSTLDALAAPGEILEGSGPHGLRRGLRSFARHSGLTCDGNSQSKRLWGNAPGYSIDPLRGSSLRAIGVKMSHYLLVA